MEPKTKIAKLRAMNSVKEKIVEVLLLNGRESIEDIASKLKLEPETVNREIKKMLEEKYILNFVPILHPDKANGKKIFSLIEVEIEPERSHGFDKVAQRISNFPEVINAFLVSGGQDLYIEIEGKSVQEIGKFVAEKISVIPGVRKTATKFVLKKYKEKGVFLPEEGEESKPPVSF